MALLRPKGLQRMSWAIALLQVNLSLSLAPNLLSSKLDAEPLRAINRDKSVSSDVFDA